jgi:hypothetical protein
MGDFAEFVRLVGGTALQTLGKKFIFIKFVLDIIDLLAYNILRNLRREDLWQ